MQQDHNYDLIQQHITKHIQKDSGLAYIHCPYPEQIPLDETIIPSNKNMIVVVGFDHHSNCMGCLFLFLDNFVLTKLRFLYLHLQFHIVIVEIAPQTHDTTLDRYTFLLRIQQFTKQFLIHFIIIDRSIRNLCGNWPIFSLVVLWYKNDQKFVVIV